jgi:hypothetical protein
MDQALDIRAVAGKKRLRLAVKREMVAEVIAMHGLSERRACGLLEITRRSFRRPPARPRILSPWSSSSRFR